MLYITQQKGEVDRSPFALEAFGSDIPTPLAAPCGCHSGVSRIQGDPLSFAGEELW